MSAFEEALSNNPAPTALGDVMLRYEPSLLIGETKKRGRTIRPSLVWVLGFAALLFAIAGLAFQGADWLIALLLMLAAALTFGASRLERFEKGRRAFVLNFEANRLRLDFETALAGRPRTLHVDFDAVRSVELVEQADTLLCITVDFVLSGAKDQLFREVLVAYVPRTDEVRAHRLCAFLKGAFGLGEVPSDSPFITG